MRLGVDRGTHLGQRTGAAPNRPDTRTLSNQIRIFLHYPLAQEGPSTHDPRRYASYFPKVELVTPS